MTQRRCQALKPWRVVGERSPSRPLAIAFVLLAVLPGCHPPPPRILRFAVTPPNTCATVPVDIAWNVDADSVRLDSDPHTNTPSGDLPGLSSHIAFRTATMNTTFTLSAARGDHPPATQTLIAHIVPNPFTTGLELPYDCSTSSWLNAGISDRDYIEVLTVQTVTNNATQPLVIIHGGQLLELAPGETRAFDLPTRLTGDRWQARVANGLSPICSTAGPIDHGPPPTPVVPPPVQITVTAFCPAPR